MSGMNPFGVVVTDVANCGGNEVERCFAVDGPEVTPYQLLLLKMMVLSLRSYLKNTRKRLGMVKTVWR